MAIQNLIITIEREYGSGGRIVGKKLGQELGMNFYDDDLMRIASEKSAVGDDAYGGRISASVAKMEKDEQNGMAPEAAAKTIVKVALKGGRVKPYYTIGFSYKLLVLLDSLLPCRAVRWLLFLLYGK